MPKADFFISYRSLDRKPARAIRDVLAGAGYSTIFQTINMQEGDPAASIAKAFQDSHVLLACVTRSYPTSIWTNQEFLEAAAGNLLIVVLEPVTARIGGRSWAFVLELWRVQNPVVQRKLLLDAAEYFVS
jgi:TIR domain